MAYFRAANLVKNRKAITVRFSAEAEKGSMTAIVGVSGSGKSTVLRMISGLLAPDSGRASVMIDGRELTGIAPGRRGIGMVFQNGALFAHMKVVDNVAYGLSCRGVGRREGRKRAEAFLARFGLEGFAGRWPESLSGGEAQRVSLARTLIVGPDLVLLDEPFSALDAPLRKKLAADILSMQRETGFTGIMVTHDLAEARGLCSHIIVMRQGSVSWNGAAEEFGENLLNA